MSRAMTSPLASLRGFLGRLSRNEGGSMLFAFTVSTVLLRLAGNMCVTRLLNPYAFGVMGVVATVMMVLTMISDFGFAAFVIRHEKGSDPDTLDTIWTVRLAQAAAQAAIMFVAAVPVAHLIGKTEMAMPVMLCAPILLLNALCPISFNLAQRQGKVRKTCAIEFGALAIQVAVNVALAVVLRDYRALVIGLYVGAIAKALITLRLLPGSPRLRFERPVFAEIADFARVVMPSTMLTLAITQSDKLLFARLFSLYNFGVYVLAANLALSFQPFGRNYVLRYFYPLMARTWRENPGGMAALFYAARARIYPVMFGLFGLGVGLAPVVIALLFDHRYESGWIFLSVMLLRTALDLDNFASTQTLMAMSHAKATLHANIIRIILFALALFATYRQFGPLSLPLAQLIAEAVTLVYLARLLDGHGLFRWRSHAIYFAALAIGLALGVLVSMLAMPGLTLAGVENFR